MPTNYPINPRLRAYGKARIDIAQHVQSPADWDRLWKSPTYPFPFVWGEAWKQCIEYKVDDFAAEAGFFIDVLGLPVNAFSPTYAMFTSPQGDFFFSFIPTPDGESSTPADAIRLQFMVADIFATTRELEKRGISFEIQPMSSQPGSPLRAASFRTPHGIPVDLWGEVLADSSSIHTTEPALTAPLSADNGGNPRLEEDNHDEDGEDEELDEGEEEEEDDESEIEEGEINGDGNLGLLEEDEEDEEFLEGGEDDEGDEDLGEDEEEEDLDLDEDDEFDEDEDDEDDDIDLDEDRLVSSVHDQKYIPVPSQPAIKVGTAESSGKLRIYIKEQAPEYIDLDIT